MFRNLTPGQAFQMVFDMNTLIQNTVPADEQGRFVSDDKRKESMETLMSGLYWTLVEAGIGAELPPMSIMVDEELNIIEERVPLEAFIERVNADLCGWKLMLHPTDWYQGYVSIVKL